MNKYQKPVCSNLVPKQLLNVRPNPTWALTMVRTSLTPPSFAPSCSNPPLVMLHAVASKPLLRLLLLGLLSLYVYDYKRLL